jgi:hypothetical protein
MPEFESFIETQRKRLRVTAAAEINISGACALTIRARGGFNGIGVCWVQHVLCTFWLYNAYVTITSGLIRYFLTPVSRAIDTVFTHCPSAIHVISTDREDAHHFFLFSAHTAAHLPAKAELHAMIPSSSNRCLRNMAYARRWL